MFTKINAAPRFLECMTLAMLLGACSSLQQAPSGSSSGTTPPPRTNAGVNLSGYPPAFKDGFSDGCESLRGSYRRDAARFGKDNDYTLGWQDGYSICGRQKR
jgi:hypothetical protein